jgi:hypothetical protein
LSTCDAQSIRDLLDLLIREERNTVASLLERAARNAQSRAGEPSDQARTLIRCTIATTFQFGNDLASEHTDRRRHRRDRGRCNGCRWRRGRSNRGSGGIGTIKERRDTSVDHYRR